MYCARAALCLQVTSTSLESTPVHCCTTFSKIDDEKCLSYTAILQCRALTAAAAVDAHDLARGFRHEEIPSTTAGKAQTALHRRDVADADYCVCGVCKVLCAYVVRLTPRHQYPVLLSTFYKLQSVLCTITPDQVRHSAGISASGCC